MIVDIPLPLIMVIRMNPKCDDDGRDHSKCIGDVMATQFVSINDLKSELVEFNKDDDEWKDADDAASSSVSSAVKWIAGGDDFFVVSKDKWDPNTANNIRSLFGDRAADALLDVANRSSWPMFGQSARPDAIIIDGQPRRRY